MIQTTEYVPVSTFNTICRTCLSVKENCSMFEVNCGAMSICSMLEKYTGIRVEDNVDIFPTNICQNCIELLCISFQFFETCHRSEKILLNSLQKATDTLDNLSVEENVVTENIIVKIEVDEEDGNDNQDDEGMECSEPIEDPLEDPKDCDHCKTRFQTEDEYQDHLRPNNNKCTICKLVFYCSVLLTKHFESDIHKTLSAHKKCNGVCVSCDLIFEVHADFVNHFIEKHTGETKCIHCSKFCDNVVEHLEVHNKVKKIKMGRRVCETCGKSVSRRYYRLHLDVHKDEYKYECNLCGNKFKYVNNLRRHKRIHLGHLSLCPHCGKAFTAMSSLKTHIKNAHDSVQVKAGTVKDDIFMCDTCGFICTTLRGYRRHLTEGHGEKAKQTRTPTCFVCKRTFETRDDLNKHKEEHQRYECPVCSKQFLSHIMYKNHVEKHESNKKRSNVNSDSDEKNRELPFECKECGKRFRIKTNLKYHEFLHLGLKPFKCKLCSKTFRQPAHVRTHMFQHTGERKYKCKLCSKSFIQPSLLNSHMRIHTGEKPFSCPICAKKFHDLGGMHKHHKRHINNIQTQIKTEVD